MRLPTARWIEISLVQYKRRSIFMYGLFDYCGIKTGCVRVGIIQSFSHIVGSLMCVLLDQQGRILPAPHHIWGSICPIGYANFLMKHTKVVFLYVHITTIANTKYGECKRLHCFSQPRNAFVLIELKDSYGLHKCAAWAIWWRSWQTIKQRGML